MQTLADTPIQHQLELMPPVVFGNPTSITRRGPETIDRDRIVAAAEVTVNRTPMFEVVGERTPIDIYEDWDDAPEWWLVQEEPDTSAWDFTASIARYGVIVDHDPNKYAPYTDLVCDGNPSYSTTYYLVTIV